MRYQLFNIAGDVLAQADTAQKIGDAASHGTYCEDTDARGAWRFTAYERDTLGLIGVPMMYRVDAILYCQKIGG